MSVIGNVVLPSLEVEATGYTEEPEYLAMNMCLSNLAVSQLCNNKFDSLCKFGEVYIGAGPDGIFTLEDSDTYDGVEIFAAVELPLTDFGISNQKRLRKAFVGYETAGELTFIVKNDEANEREYTLTAKNTLNLEHGSKVSINRDGCGRYWGFRIENVDGCDFSLDMISVFPVIRTRKPSGL
jgi:hypothetical protein